MIKDEIKSIFHNKKLLIPIIAVLFIPILYSGMFLWAFWDPYDRLPDLPVAIVNEDEGSNIDGQKVNLGDDLVTKLEESMDFNFSFLEKEKAYDGLEKQKYYLIVEIPKDFSKNAATLLDKEPKKLSLIYVPNEGFNFLASQIGETAIDRIKMSLSEKVSETYAETMFDKIGELSEGIEQAGRGAERLSNGALELKEGSVTLHDKLAMFARKSIEFNNGIDQVKAGSNELYVGTKKLSEGLGQLQEGQSQLSKASNQLLIGNEELVQGISKTRDGLIKIDQKFPDIVNGTNELQAGVSTLSHSLNLWQQEAQKVSGGMKVLQENLQKIIAQMPEDSMERIQLEELLNQVSVGSAQLGDTATQLASGAETISDNMGKLSLGQKELHKGIEQLILAGEQLEDGANKVTQGQQDFHSGMLKFNSKIAEAKKGADTLTQGAADLSSGLLQVQDGSNLLTTGASQLEDGAKKIAMGNSELLSGNEQLAEKLLTGAKEASIKVNENNFNMMANPVEVSNKKINKVPNYGTGFAPYFLSLGLFVGALLLSIVFPLREPSSAPCNGLQWFTSKFIILSTIGMIQGIIAATILIIGLGLEVKSVPLFILFSILTSLVFISLIQFLVTLFGDPGRFIAIVILILQLTTSAGTFPLELIPNFLQPFNTLLPMTYTVQGFKSVISSGDFGFMWENTMVLALYIAGCIIGTIFYFNMMFKRKYGIFLEQN